MAHLLLYLNQLFSAAENLVIARIQQHLLFFKVEIDPQQKIKNYIF